MVPELISDRVEVTKDNTSRLSVMATVDSILCLFLGSTESSRFAEHLPNTGDCQTLKFYIILFTLVFSGNQVLSGNQSSIGYCTYTF